MNTLFVTCSQDMEPLLVEELHELGFNNVSQQFRGVLVKDASMDAVYRINYCSRIASRVLLPLSSFRCKDKYSLYDGIAKVNWLKYIPTGKTFAIDANVNHPDLRNSLFASQVTKDAICDQFRDATGSRPSINVKDPDIQLNLFITKDWSTISYDTSRTPLFKRGYRLENVEAPLRESLAAALLRIAKYTGEEILYDPCCGSGTILIEAALIATATAPGYLRQNWGFATLPQFDLQAWLKIKNEIDSRRKTLSKGKIFGTDVNKTAIHACKVNLRAAGFHSAIETVQYDFRDYTPSMTPNLMVTNPPHGNRLNDVDFLKPLYRSLGDFMKQKMAKPSRAFVFVGNLDLSKEVGLAPTQRHVIDNAGIDSRLLEFDLY